MTSVRLFMATLLELRMLLGVYDIANWFDFSVTQHGIVNGC
jgi:hypothetical protein